MTKPRRPGLSLVPVTNRDRHDERPPFGRYDKPVVLRIFPDRFVRGELGKARVEDVDGIGKKLGKAANKPRREIRVKKKLQRDMRSRPACEA